MLVTSAVTVVRPCGPDGIGRGVDVGVFECGVAEAPAEGEERERAAVDIFAFGGRLLVVVDGKLADRARDGDGQFCAGIVVAENDVGDGGAAFLAEIPTVENRGDVFGDVVDGVGAAVLQKYDGRLAGREDCFDEIVLIAVADRDWCGRRGD